MSEEEATEVSNMVPTRIFHNGSGKKMAEDRKPESYDPTGFNSRMLHRKEIRDKCDTIQKITTTILFTILSVSIVIFVVWLGILVHTFQTAK